MSLLKTEIIIIGAGGHALSVADAIYSTKNLGIKGFVDSKRKGDSIHEIGVFENIQDIEGYKEYLYCVAIGDNYLREKVSVELIKEFPGISFTSIFHH